MDRRTRFFWSISIMAGVFVILIEGISLYNVRADRLDFAKAAEKTIIGTDEELEEIIVFLEQNLELRSKFRFDLKNNPLKLDKVVFLADEQGETDQQHAGKHYSCEWPLCEYRSTQSHHRIQEQGTYGESG